LTLAQFGFGFSGLDLGQESLGIERRLSFNLHKAGLPKIMMIPKIASFACHFSRPWWDVELGFDEQRRARASVAVYFASNFNRTRENFLEGCRAPLATNDAAIISTAGAGAARAWLTGA
jgi:hypothetical protein